VTKPIGPGPFVAVIGASGVGKDALLSYARERAGASACFPRRAITRRAGPGEDHDPMEVEEFASALENGAFAVWWQAHGLCYGIPDSVDTELRAGRPVVVNVSRGVLGLLASRYERLIVIRVTVPDAIRATRLRARQRESINDIAQRLDRVDPSPDHPVDAEIRNDGPLHEGGAQLLRIIRDAGD
jgi:ribose 1,5-bisphosphokinase